MDRNGNWDLNLLSTIFPYSVISHVISIRGPDSNDIVDQPYWKLSNSRSFSIRSAYDSLERLMTNVEHCRRFIGQSSSCPCCHELAETTIHVFVTVHWRLLDGRFCFPWIVVLLWNNRNNWVFNGHHTPTESVLHKCITWTKYYAKSGLFQHRVTPGNGLYSPICWKRPDVGWVCLNTDGDVSSLSGFRYVGRVFRAHDGSWILGFNKAIGVVQPLQAELWAIFTGFQIARDNGFERLVIQSDSLEAIQRLNASSAATDVHALVHAIDRLRNARWATILQWIPCDANKLADAIAQFDTSYDLSLFAAPPSPLQQLLASDCSSLLWCVSLYLILIPKKN
ncbi:hypothetical protein V6N11_049396 [Hibiscus sabdariffa]